MFGERDGGVTLRSWEATGSHVVGIRLGGRNDLRPELGVLFDKGWYKLVKQAQGVVAD